jgi:hypothetical protein
MSRLERRLRQLEPSIGDEPLDGPYRFCWDGDDCTDHAHDMVLRWIDLPAPRKDSDEPL